MSIDRFASLPLLAATLFIAACSQGEPPTTAVGPAEPSVSTAPAAPVQADLATTLPANHWTLVTAVDGSGQSIPRFFPNPDQPLGIDFMEGGAHVTGGCNRISASYQVPAPDQVQFGPGRSTMMACPPPLGDADKAMAMFLTGTLQASLADEAGTPMLKLAMLDGTTLTLKGSPTAETRFGGPGVRAFLEVSTEPCAAPATSPPCIMVRDRSFDGQGLESGTPGEWRALPEGIEGFTPSAGEQQVVRVKRFDAAAGTHFVFDMVVQSRTVN
jgi:heat shock protein HslJ